MTFVLFVHVQVPLGLLCFLHLRPIRPTSLSRWILIVYVVVYCPVHFRSDVMERIEPLVPAPSLVEVEIAIGKLRSYKIPRY
jgi:hypothetical protein